MLGKSWRLSTRWSISQELGTCPWHANAQAVLANCSSTVPLIRDFIYADACCTRAIHFKGLQCARYDVTESQGMNILTVRGFLCALKLLLAAPHLLVHVRVCVPACVLPCAERWR